MAAPRHIFLVFLTTSLILLHRPIPIHATRLRTTYKVPISSENCLIEKLHEKEHVTFGVTITSGDELKALASIFGPVAPDSVTSPEDVESHLQRYKEGQRFGNAELKAAEKGRGFDAKGNLNFQDYLDHEHRSDFYPGGYEDYDYMHDDDIVEQDRGRRRRSHRGRREVQGDEWQETFEVKTAGWYRACVKARKNEVYAEMELRKSSELGLDKSKTHVLTWENYERIFHEHEIDEDAAKETDLETAKSKLKDLNNVIYKIRDIQREEQKRLEVHKSINEHSHKRMVWGSLFETAIFIAVSFIQVMTIRRWFKDPILGM